MKKTIAVIMLLWSAFAVADSRIAAIEQAWNKADHVALQAGFDDVYHQVRFAYYSENGGVLTVINSGRVAYKTFAAVVQVEDRKEVWVFLECENSHKWCYWDHRPVAIIGGAALGQSFDLSTTAVAVGMGFTEANPIGLGIIPAKIGLTVGSHYLQYDKCMGLRTGLDVLGYGAGMANIATMLGAAPVGAASALAVTVWYRYSSAVEDARFECAEYALAD